MLLRYLSPRLRYGRHLVVRNGLFGWFGLGGSTVVVVAMTPPLLAFLGTDQFGVWTICMSLLGVAGFAEIGLGTATARFIAEDAASGRSDNFTQIVTAAVLLAIVIGLIAAIAVWALAPAAPLAVHATGAARAGMVPAIRTAALGIPAVLIKSVCLAVPAGLQRYSVVAAFSFLQTLLLWTLAAIAATSRSSIVLVVISSVGTLWCMALVSVAIAAPSISIRPSRQLLSWTAFRRIAHYSAVSAAGGLGIQMFGSLDKVTVGIALGASAVTYYSIAVALTSKINQLMGVFWQPLMPACSALMARRNYRLLWRYFAYSTLLCGIFCLVVALVLLAVVGMLLDLWLGNSASDQVLRPLQILIAVYAAFTVATPACHIANGMGSPGVCAVAAIVGGIMTVGLIVPLSRVAGLEGAALANGGYLVALVVVAYLFCKLRPGLSLGSNR